LRSGLGAGDVKATSHREQGGRRREGKEVGVLHNRATDGGGDGFPRWRGGDASPV